MDALSNLLAIMSGFKRRGHRKRNAGQGLKLPSIGRNSNSTNPQDDVVEEVQRQRSLQKEARRNTKRKKKSKNTVDHYANNPLGKFRPKKYKPVVYKKRKPKPPTKVGVGLTDKRGKIRMFREPKRSLQQLESVKKNAMATIKSISALVDMGQHGKVKREDAEKRLQKVIKSAHQSRDPEELRSGIKRAALEGLRADNSVMLKAQALMQRLILEALLRNKIDECKISRDELALREAITASLKGGLPKKSRMYSESMKLLGVLETEADARESKIATLIRVTEITRFESDMGNLEQAIADVLAHGVTEDHDAVVAGQKRLTHLVAARKLRQAAERRLRNATKDARRSREKLDVQHALKQCIDLAAPDGPGSAIQEARQLLQELAADEDSRNAAIAALAATTDVAYRTLKHEVTRPDGRARIREVKAMMVDAIAQVEGKIAEDHVVLIEANNALTLATKKLQAVEDAEASLLKYIDNADQETAPIDAAEIHSRIEAALDAHVPEQESAAIAKAKCAIDLLVDAANLAVALKAAAQTASEIWTRVSRKPNVYTRQDNITLPVATEQEAISGARAVVQDARSQYNEWMTSNDSNSLSSAQKERFNRAVLVPHLRSIETMFGTESQSDVGRLNQCCVDLQLYLDLYVATLSVKDQIKGLRSARDASVDTSTLTQCLECAVKSFIDPHNVDAFFVQEAKSLLAQVSEEEAAAKQRALTEHAQSTFRVAIVKCCSDQNTEALGAAKATALAAGVAEDSAECQIAAKLVAQLIPHLGDLVRDTEAWTDEWYSDKRKVREADLEWMQAALPKLQVAADFRSHAVQVKGASALSPASLTLDNVVTFPTAEQDNVLERAQSMVQELHESIAALHKSYATALVEWSNTLRKAIDDASASRLSSALKHILQDGFRGIPNVSPKTVGLLNLNAEIAAGTKSHDTLKRTAESLVVTITKESEAAVNSACDSVSTAAQVMPCTVVNWNALHCSVRLKYVITTRRRSWTRPNSQHWMIVSSNLPLTVIWTTMLTQSLEQELFWPSFALESWPFRKLQNSCKRSRRRFASQRMSLRWKPQSKKPWPMACHKSMRML